jgi:predicted ribosome quality control (RQC) complex YloA/Tae2 family protein
MQNNYYFLRQLSQQLEKLLSGSQLLECYSQSKGELSIGFAQQGGKEIYLKGTFQPDFTCLYLPPQLQRARRNSVDLFSELIGKKVAGIEQYSNDRSFSICFEEDLNLLFKLHGNRANVLLVHGQQPISLFKNKLAKDWQLQPAQLHRQVQPNFEDFIAAAGDPRKVFPTLGPEPLAYLQEKGWNRLPLEERWQQLLDFEQQLLQPNVYWVCEIEEKPHLLLFEQGQVLFSTEDPVAALNYFYRSFTHDWALRREKSNFLQSLDRQIKGTENYLYKLLQKQEELQTSASHRHQADLIMANLHNIPTGAEKVELTDFYSGQPLVVKLKKELSPQKNAEQYYRKAKNQQLEIQHLEDNLADKESRLEKLQQLRSEVEAEEDLKKLRSIRKEQLPDNEQQQTLPYRQFEFQQHQILVGKGASQNDELLRYHSRKDDLWLHAKDVTGSHVIIRRQPGKAVPRPVKEKAAQLAAWYSKRKSDTLCPVICTPRKWVRKSKGAPAGAVMVDKEEEVLLVEPKAFE